MEEIIVSTSNPRIKNVIKLKEKPSERKAQGLVVVEGAREILRAKENNYEIRTLFICDAVNQKRNKEVLVNIHHLVRVNKEVFEKIAYRENSDGLLALVSPRRFRLSDLRLSDNPLLIILESVEKPGNLGAMVRTADGAGADAVIVCDPRTDVYNPNAIRSSIGCVFSKQVVAASTEEVQKFLQDRNIRPFAASLKGKKSYTEVNLAGPCAIVFGTEAHGLSASWLDSSEQVKIPMLGKVDSLNVSASCAVLVYEAVRQRGNMVK